MTQPRHVFQTRGIVVLLTAYGLWLTAAVDAVVAVESPTRLQEIVVTATRNEMPASKLTKAVTVVSDEQIEAQHTPTVAEALRDVPGAVVRPSGAFGRTTAVVLRGSNPNQVLVMRDGVPINSPTLGSYDFSTLPTDGVERIEVLRGSSSTLYGSEAIGGVINIISKRGEGPMHTTYRQEFGTRRTFRETLANQAQFGPAHYAVTLGRTDVHGYHKHNTLVESTNLAASAGVEVSKQLGFDVNLLKNNSRVGIDDGAFRPDPNRLVTRQELSLSTTMNATLLDPWRQEVRLLYHDDDTSDIDPPDPGTTQANSDSRINTDRYGIDWIHHIDLGSAGVSTTGLQWKDDEAESRFKNTVKQWAWLFQHQLEVQDRLTLIGGVRINEHSLFGEHTTTEASASYRIPVTETTVRGGFSTGFRAPTLNDLFFPNFGNTELNPETSRTYEVGLRQEAWHHRAGVDGTWYLTDTQDLIQAARVTSTVFQAQNISRARMSGVEMRGWLDPIDALHLGANWTYTDATDRIAQDELTRIPAMTWSADIRYDFLRRWRLTVHPLFVGHQEESTGANCRQRVKAYGRLDGSISVQATKELNLYLRVENLLNRHYSEVLGFPAAETLVFIGGTVEL